MPTSRSTLGLKPVQDALAYEAIDSEYVNVLVTDSAHASNSDLQKLGTALGSESAKAFITVHYKGAILPAE